jgi:hypothetical protein
VTVRSWSSFYSADDALGHVFQLSGEIVYFQNDWVIDPKIITMGSAFEKETDL